MSSKSHYERTNSSKNVIVEWLIKFNLIYVTLQRLGCPGNVEIENAIDIQTSILKLALDIHM